jgi:hypothetical protein
MSKQNNFYKIILFRISRAKRTKKNPLLVWPFKEKKAVKTLPPSEEGLEPGLTYKYEIFPKFSPTLFIAPRKVESYDEERNTLMKTLITND